MLTSYKFGRFELRPATRELLVDGRAADVGRRAFDLLHGLIERRERIVDKRELFELVWPGLVVEENNLQVQVSSLRKILGTHAITTIPGHGYRFSIPLDIHELETTEEMFRRNAIARIDAAIVEMARERAVNEGALLSQIEAYRLIETLLNQPSTQFEK